MSGTLPSSLRNLKQLRQLALGANFLHGPLPRWLGGLSELRELRLGANLGTNNDSSRGFQGNLQDALGNLTNLQVCGWWGGGETAWQPFPTVCQMEHLMIMPSATCIDGLNAEIAIPCSVITSYLS